MSDDPEKFSDAETKRRFEAITRAVLNTPPLKKKDIPRKRPYKARKQRPMENRASKS